MNFIDKIMEFITGRSKEERRELSRIKQKIRREKERGYWKGRLENAEKEGKEKAKREIKSKQGTFLSSEKNDKNNNKEFSIVNGWQDKKRRYLG